MLMLGYTGILLGFGLLGLLRAAQIKKRPQELREFINALLLLDTEIVWGITPLPEAFAVLKRRTALPWQYFFAELEDLLQGGESADTAWKKTVRKQKGRFCLNNEDWDVILELGNGLGRSDKKQQHKYLELAQKHLESLKEDAEINSKQKAKMWSYLGFLGGMALVIFLV